MSDIGMRVVFNHFPRIAVRFEPEVVDIVNTGVFDLVATADPMTPVDTGDLKGHKQFDMASAGNIAAKVTWTMGYAAYVDQGTTRMAAQPYATPAADAVFPTVVANLSALEGRIA